jgi:chromate transporter
MSIVTQMENDFVDKRGWITQAELLDMVSVGRSLPGIMIANIAVLFGYKVAGIPGVIAASLGLTLPSIIALTIVTAFYDRLKDQPLVAKAMAGVRAAVVPIILVAALKLRKTALESRIGWALAALALLLALFTNLNNVFIILIGAAAGFLLKGGHESDLP